jgi:maleylpyruvate isomerase
MTLASVLDVLRRRTDLTLGALAPLSDDELLGPSELSNWSILTIVCHLRYGASALLQMTDDALAGRPASYYPGGRTTQRPGTLHPADGEMPRDVVHTMASVSADLQRRWEALSEADWAVHAVEPDDNPDLGPQPLAALPLFRLTEVEVHSTDLGIGIPDWDE